MPDTGAPWNIPYVASSDLVSDWPTDSLALANAIDAGLDTAYNAGIGSNVETGTLSSTFTTTSASLVDTGLETTITLESATSSVLLIMQAPSLTTSSGADIAVLGLTRDATALNARAYSQTTVRNAVSMVWVDTPGSVGPHTYKVQALITGGSTLSMFAASTARPFITAIEVAA